MKKTQRALAIVLGVIALGSAAFFLYWAYVIDKYGQHLPLKEISVGGLTREYHLFVPATLTEEPMPLVILLNGGSAGIWRFPQQFDWQALGEEKGFIIAVPVGKLVPPNEGAWQLNSHAGAYHDINFVKAMIDDIPTIPLSILDRLRKSRTKHIEFFWNTSHVDTGSTQITIFNDSHLGAEARRHPGCPNAPTSCANDD